MNSAATWIARLSLLVASIVLMTIIAELVVSRVAPQNLSIWDNTRDGMTIHRAHADTDWPRFARRIRTNRFGMRDVERSLEKPPNHFRVIVLGDSFMEALQVSYEESFPALLEKKIGEKRKEAEVINLSVSGWGTDDEVTYLKRRGMAFGPDGVVLMMTLHNDVIDNSRLQFHTPGGSGIEARPIEFMPATRYAIQKLKAYLAGTSHLYQLAYQTYVRDGVRRGAAQLDLHVADLLSRRASRRLERDWRFTLALLDHTADLLESQGVWLAVALIPLRVQVDDDAFEELMESHGMSAREMDRTAPQRRVVEWAQNRGILSIDLLPSFAARAAESDDVLYLPEDGHWSAAGHALAADEVSRRLEKARLIDQAGR